MPPKRLSDDRPHWRSAGRGHVSAMSPPPTFRIGWCCQFIPPDGDAERARRMNYGTVTIAALGRLSRPQAVEKLVEVVGRNLAALGLQLEEIAAGPPHRRMLRVFSGLLPAYTHELGRPLYREPVLRALVETGLAAAGAFARTHHIRLGFHPEQFCVLNSAAPATLANAVGELDFHAELMAMLGVPGGWHPEGASINIHCGARAGGVEGFLAGLGRLSSAARDLITVENDEIAFGLDDLLPLAERLPIVLDLHHHWIKSEGAYLDRDDPRLALVRASWRGARPLAHLSVSREDLLDGHDPEVRPDYAFLTGFGLKPTALRAHSDRMWNRAVNRWAAGHLAWADLEIEAKAKNLAADDFERDLPSPRHDGLVLEQN
jgi:UV DNA damage endonuclease